MKAYWLQQADAWAQLAQEHAHWGNTQRVAQALLHLDEALERYFRPRLGL
jgi:hypothetical protein